MENIVYNNSNINNVTSLPIKGLNYYIDLFLRSRAENSQSIYKSAIDLFLTYTTGKTIINITWNDLLDESLINFARVKEYFLYLKNDYRSSKTHKKLANNSINNYITIVKELFKELSNSNPNINTNLFNSIKRLSLEKNHYGALTDTEMKELIEYAKTEPYRGDIKSITLKFMYCTGIRKSATLSLKWSDIKKKLNYDTNKYYYCIQNKHDKTGNINVNLSDEIYQDMLSIKMNDSDLVFNIYEETLRKTLNNFCKKYDIDKKERNISLHSIKHSAILKVLKKTNNNIAKAMVISHHKNEHTLVDNYSNEEIDLEEDPIHTFFDNVDTSIIEKASKKDLVKAIQNCCPEGIQNLICNYLKNKNEK